VRLSVCGAWATARHRPFAARRLSAFSDCWSCFPKRASCRLSAQLAPEGHECDRFLPVGLGLVAGSPFQAPRSQPGGAARACRAASRFRSRFSRSAAGATHGLRRGVRLCGRWIICSGLGGVPVQCPLSRRPSCLAPYCPRAGGALDGATRPQIVQAFFRGRLLSWEGLTAAARLPCRAVSELQTGAHWTLGFGLAGGPVHPSRRLAFSLKLVRAPLIWFGP